MGWTVSDELVSTGVTEFQERAGKIGAVEEIADFIQNEYLADDKSDAEDLFGDDSRSAVNPETANFRITDGIDLGGGGAKTKYRRNISAIQTLHKIESKNRYATPDELYLSTEKSTTHYN
jgi:hypothetical protein